MTFDDVVTKTAITMACWFSPPRSPGSRSRTALMFPALILSGLVGFVVVLVVSFRRAVNPALVLVYAAIEGVFIGMISKYFENAVRRHRRPGGARDVRRRRASPWPRTSSSTSGSPRSSRRSSSSRPSASPWRCWLNFLLSLAGINLGLRDGGTGPVSLLAVGVALLGAVLAVLNLVLDFDYIEKGVAMGAPAEESWRGAFGLTVTMVWLYIEILRLLSYLRR